jgi:hypothetical protein
MNLMRKTVATSAHVAFHPHGADTEIVGGSIQHLPKLQQDYKLLAIGDLFMTHHVKTLLTPCKLCNPRNLVL